MVHQTDSSSYGSSSSSTHQLALKVLSLLAMASSDAVRAVFIFAFPWFDTVSCQPTRRYAPIGHPTAALLPQTFELLSLALAFVLGGWEGNLSYS